MSKTHLILTKFMSQCGYFTYNITPDKSKVDCKWCKQIIKKMGGAK